MVEHLPEKDLESAMDADKHKKRVKKKAWNVDGHKKKKSLKLQF